MSIFSARTRRFRIAPRQNYLGLVIGAMVAMGGLCSAQSTVLAVASGSGTSGNVVNLQLSLASSPGARTRFPAMDAELSNWGHLEYDSWRSAGVVAGAKSLVCSGSTCLLYGLNAQIIPNGLVATLTFQLNATTSGNLPLALSRMLWRLRPHHARRFAFHQRRERVRFSPLLTPTGALGEVAAGGSLTTGIFILNTGSVPAAYIIQFYDDNGKLRDASVHDRADQPAQRYLAAARFHLRRGGRRTSGADFRLGRDRCRSYHRGASSVPQLM